MKKEITIVLFDLDNTLYKHDTEGQWLQHLTDLGVLDKKENNRKIKYFDEEYVKGRLKIDKYFEYVLYPLTQHKKSTLHRWRKDFIKKRIKPKISKKAHSLVNKHKKLKHKLIMVTAANSFVAEPIAQFFGMHHMIASKVIEKKGQYTNKTEKNRPFKKGKVISVKKLIKKEKYNVKEIWSYSDSHNDLPLLKLGDHSIAVNPDNKLRKFAVKKNWKIIKTY